ncbi:hypothetical protein LS71_002780 [Helicobacter jaachi]|uniref:Uncharacterized protein n=1 Tax=Helicobacter jaachi TaxID=1677920 RepID=A0A4V6YSB8_9HELI|nr:hypothetical protein LS71_002780 [Helicobacter jaachi]
MASLDTILELGVSKIACISKNYYLKIGANEERISFEATIFIEHLEHFNGLIDKIKACKPLSLSTLESTQMRHILIDTFSSKTQSWQLDSMRNLTYHTKVFNISGVVL